MINKIKNYFGLEIPIWMQSRKNLFFLFCLDFSLILFIKSVFIKNNFDPKSVFLNVPISILWCLIGYIIGKYSYYKKSNNLLSKLQSLIKSSLITLTIIFITDKLIILFIPEIIPFGKNKILILGLLSYLIHSIKLSIYFLNINKQKRFIYLIGDTEELNIFKNLLKEYLKTNKIILRDYYGEKIKNNNLSEFVIFNNAKKESNLRDFYKEIDKINASIYTPFSWCEKYLHRIPVIYLSDETYSEDQWIKDTDNFEWRLKRFGDIFVSIILTIISLPIIIIAGILIWFEDKGPIFYSQVRTGFNNKSFTIIKLRTMKILSEKNGPVWASKNDSRITNTGKILRRTRIDELPQLISVLIGDMSLIGPRPERPEIELTLKREIPFYEIRYKVKPGLSGWAQVNYPYGASVKDSENKISYDFFYIRNYSFLLDILIFIKTLKTIFNMKGSNPS